MAKIVEILPTSDQVKCAAGESCSVDVSFTNITAGKIRVGAKILPGDKVLEQWFKPAEGGAERDLDPKTTEKLSFKAKIPADAKPGAYTLQVMLFDVKQPEDYFDVSQTVRLDIGAPAVAPKPVESKPFPWWIPAVVLGVLLVAGVGIFLALQNGNVAVPGVVGLPADQATSALEAASFSVSRVDQHSTSPLGQVLSQDPPEGTEVKKQSQVVIHVAAAEPMVDVPNLIRVPFEDAESLLRKLNLKAVRKGPPKATLEFQAGQVTMQSPGFPNRVKPGTTVELEVAGPSVRVPSVKGQTLPAAMEAMAKAQLFVEVTGDQSKLQERVTGTTPAEDAVVLTQSKVQIHMPGNVLIFIPPQQIRLNPLFGTKMQMLRQVMPEGGPPAKPENK